MSVEERAFREALGSFVSGVCVVTALAPDGSPLGVTITSFTSLSLHPPLVLFCIGNKSTNADAWLTATAFTVNLLAERQIETSEVFASQRADKFAHVVWQPGANGCPALHGCIGWIECALEAVHPGGDHTIIVGRVERTAIIQELSPLVRFRGRYHLLGTIAADG